MTTLTIGEFENGGFFTKHVKIYFSDVVNNLQPHPFIF